MADVAKNIDIRAKGWEKNKREKIRKWDQFRKSHIQITNNPEREKREFKMEKLVKDKFPNLKDIASRLKELD